MSSRPPEQVRLYDLFKTIVAVVLFLILLALLIFRFFIMRPAAVPTPTLAASPTATVVLSTQALPTVTSAPTSTVAPTVAASPTSPPSPTFDLNAAAGGGGATHTPAPAPTSTPRPTLVATNTPLPTLTLAPTATPVVVGTACPPYGARGEDLGTTYITVYCDTLSNIAERTGVSLQSLIEANPQIPDPNLIFSGNVIIIPAPRK